MQTPAEEGENYNFRSRGQNVSPVTTDQEEIVSPRQRHHHHHGDEYEPIGTPKQLTKLTTSSLGLKIVLCLAFALILEAACFSTWILLRTATRDILNNNVNQASALVSSHISSRMNTTMGFAEQVANYLTKSPAVETLELGSTFPTTSTVNVLVTALRTANSSSIQGFYMGYEETGNFLAAYRYGEDTVIGLAGPMTKVGTSVCYIEYLVTDPVKLSVDYSKPYRSPVCPYDPRVRPWYISGKSVNVSAWFSEYQYAADDAVIFAVPNLRSYYQNGKLKAVLGVDIQTASVASFISTVRLDIFNDTKIDEQVGRVVIYNTDNSQILAQTPAREIVCGEGKYSCEGQTVQSSNEPLIKEACSDLPVSLKSSFQTANSYASSTLIKLHGASWNVVVVLPKNTISKTLLVPDLWTMGIIIFAFFIAVASALWSAHLVLNFKEEDSVALDNALRNNFRIQSAPPSFLLTLETCCVAAGIIIVWLRIGQRISDDLAAGYLDKTAAYVADIVSQQVLTAPDVQAIARGAIVTALLTLENINSSAVSIRNSALPRWDRIFSTILLNFKEVSYVFAGFPSGNFLGAGQSTTGPIIAVVDNKTVLNDIGVNPTNGFCYYEYNISADGNRNDSELNPPSCTYDSTRRPWYKDGAVCTQTSCFGSIFQYFLPEDIVLALPSVAPLFLDGKLVAVVGVDTQLNLLSQYLGKLQIGMLSDEQRGNIIPPENQTLIRSQIYISDKNDCLIATSAGAVSPDASIPASQCAGLPLRYASFSDVSIVKFSANYLAGTKAYREARNLSNQRYLYSGEMHTPMIDKQRLSELPTLSWSSVVMMPYWEIYVGFIQAIGIILVTGASIIFVSVYLISVVLRLAFLNVHRSKIKCSESLSSHGHRTAVGAADVSSWGGERGEKGEGGDEDQLVQSLLQQRTKEVYESAWVHVNDAIHRRSLRHYRLDLIHLRFYWLVTNTQYQVVIFCVITFHCLLALWEVPGQKDLGCISVLPTSCRWDTVESGRPIVSAGEPSTALAFEGFFVFIYFVDFLCQAFHLGWRKLGRSKMVLAQVAIVVAMGIDVIVTGSLGPSATTRPTRVLRPLLMIVRLPAIRRSALLVISATGGFTDMFTLLLSFVLASAIIGVALFKDTFVWQDSAYGYWNFVCAVVTQFHMLSGEPYPSVLQPLFPQNISLSLFFVIILIFSFIFFVPAMIAKFYELYKTERIKQLVNARVKQVSNLLAAFEILDNERSGVLTKETFVDFAIFLDSKMNKKSDSRKVRQEALAKFEAVDIDKSGTCDKEEFCDLSRKLLIKFKNKTISSSSKSRLRQIILDTFFSIIFVDGEPRVQPSLIFSTIQNLIVVLHLLLNALDGVVFVDAFNDTFGGVKIIENENFIRNLNIGFLITHSFEVVIKMIGFTPVGYWNKGVFQKFDILVIVSAVIGFTWAYGVGNTRAGRVFGVIPILRIFTVVDQTAFLVTTFLSVIPAVANVACLVLLVMYFFSIVAMEMWSGMPHPADWPADAKQLDASWAALYEDDIMGFRTFTSSMYTLFQLFLASNYQDIVFPIVWFYGLEAHTYFIVYLLLANILLANLFIGMVLDAFIFKLSLVENEDTEHNLWVRWSQDLTASLRGTNLCFICNKNIDTTSSQHTNATSVWSPFPCGHMFHTPCILHYDYKRGECPLCRVELKYGSGHAHLLSADVGSGDLELEMYASQLLKSVTIADIEIQKSEKLKRARICNDLKLGRTNSREAAVRQDLLSAHFSRTFPNYNDGPTVTPTIDEVFSFNIRPKFLSQDEEEAARRRRSLGLLDLEFPPVSPLKKLDEGYPWGGSLELPMPPSEFDSFPAPPSLNITHWVSNNNNTADGTLSNLHSHDLQFDALVDRHPTAVSRLSFDPNSSVSLASEAHTHHTTNSSDAAAVVGVASILKTGASSHRPRYPVLFEGEALLSADLHFSPDENNTLYNGTS